MSNKVNYKPIVGTCDCCDEPLVVLRQVWPNGLETYACAVCHGYDKDEFDYELLEEAS